MASSAATTEIWYPRRDGDLNGNLRVIRVWADVGLCRLNFSADTIGTR
jgi:hypothetical protein